MLLMAFLLLVPILLWQGWQIYSFGRQQGGFESDRVNRETQQYVQQIDAQQRELADMRAQSAKFMREAQVEREASRTLQGDLIQLRRQSDELENEVALLRSLITKKSSSLYIKRFDVYPTEVAGRYRYQLIVAQALDNIGATKGKLFMTLSGKLDGKSQKMELSQFSDDDTTTVALDFKHYQEVSGLINLLENFKPESMEIKIEPKGKKLSKMSKRFLWEVTNVDGVVRGQVDAGT